MALRSETRQTCTVAARPRTLVVVTGRPQAHAFEIVIGAVEYDVVFVVSTASAYSLIRRERPDLIIVRLSGSDREGCQVLSMLSLDGVTARIPVVTSATNRPEPAAAADDDAFDQAVHNLIGLIAAR